MAAALLPAVACTLLRSINYDIAWLSLGAERLLRGGGMLADVYETNPPLSLLIMIPPALAHMIFQLPLQYGVMLYAVAMLALSVAAVHAIVRQWPFMGERDALFFTALYALAATVFPSADFGERDHLTLLGLMPFLLAQISLTYGWKIPARAKWPAFVAGTVLILLKPHHGLLPALMLLHRAIHKRSLAAVLRSPDFLCLAAGTVIYAGFTFIFFRDYTTQILPEVMALYLPLREFLAGKILFYAFMILAFFIPAAVLHMPRAQRFFTLWLLFSAAVCLIPYGVQGKGYWYHFVPAITFYFCGVLMLLRFTLAHYFPRRDLFLLTGAAAVAVCYAVMPLNVKYPAHGDYRNFETTKIVESCPEPCSFFIFNKDVGIIHPTAVYTGRTHASRFPSFWFLPGILSGDDPLKEKYARMVTDDFERHEPGIVLIGRFTVRNGGPEDFDFVKFFSRNAAFARLWQNYEFEKTITVNRRDYYRGTALDYDDMLTFDIYRRKTNSDDPA